MDGIDPRVLSKLALEDELAEPLSRVLGGYMTTWSEGGGVMPFDQRLGFTATLRHLLERHYARVVATTLGDDASEAPSIDAVALSMQHAERLRARAHRRSLLMVDAIERDLGRSLALITQSQAARAGTAVMAATGAGTKGIDAFETKAEKQTGKTSIGIGSRFQAAAMRAYYRTRAKLRALVNLETEETAEESMFEWVKRRHGNAAVVKVWVTQGDERVRPSHEDAGDRYGGDGAIPVDQPFELAHGRLMFPGDSRLGAPLRETINCRCHLEYFARTPEGLTPLGIATPVIPARRTWRPGDRFGEEIPVSATTLVTLNGRTRARIVLGDNRTIATMTEVTPSMINVRVDGETIARAVHADGAVTSLTIAAGREGLGIEKLIRDSVSHSRGRRRSQT
jgi:hypothetical protein